MKSKTQKKDLLVIMRDKRDYVLSSTNINSKNIKEVVQYNDYIINYINSIYDNIITSKRIDDVNIKRILNKISKLTEQLKEVL